MAVDVAYEPLADSTNTATEQQAFPCWQDTAASLLWLLASLQLLAFTLCLLPGLPVTLAKAICGAAGLAAACAVLASVLDLCLGPVSDNGESAAALAPSFACMALSSSNCCICCRAATATEDPSTKLSATAVHLVYLLALRDPAVLLAAGASVADAAWLGWLDYTGAGAGSSPALQDKVFTLAMGCTLHGLMS